jgi:trimethylamine--corrinoid protein Co-methyltransferase
MKLGLKFLSEDEKHRIHQDSIKILSQVGVKFMSNKALNILEKNGAAVDYDTRIAKIPQEMVNEALIRAAKYS